MEKFGGVQEGQEGYKTEASKRVERKKRLALTKVEGEAHLEIVERIY